MTLIKSISGIRGTIGGEPDDNLTPLDIVRFVAAYATQILQHNSKPTIVVGRDARTSGPMVKQIVVGTLTAMGCNVIDIDLATTPTTEIAVTGEHADGGIILTASHNPKQWNALKLLNNNGEFLSADEGNAILEIAANNAFQFAPVDQIGIITCKDYTQIHIDKVLALPLVDVNAIRQANFTVAIDCVNSVGGIALPPLLQQLGVNNILQLNTTPDGNFAHNPEPLPENLTDIANLIANNKADVGFVVDPDVDRLAIINEDGTMFGEEYTIVAVADYILSHSVGNTVSNLSSSRALRDITNNYGATYTAAAVGEVNVVAQMKATQAIIGGEGNGGVIYPELHYGRDALVGIALFLSHLAHSGLKCSELRGKYPEYHISKNKIQLSATTNVDNILSRLKDKFANENITDIDGVKIDFADSWVHLRKSNTEPIIRIYAEAHTKTQADALAQSIIDTVKTLQ